MRFRDKITAFMYGRNGVDRFSTFLIWTALGLSVLNIFVHSVVISLLEFALFVYAAWRILSKNVYKRAAENRKFLEVWGKFKSGMVLQRNKFRDRKTHIYRVCPHCRANLRLPKAKGVHTVRCPKCNTRFEVRS